MIKVVFEKIVRKSTVWRKMGTVGTGKPYFWSRKEILQDFSAGNSQFATAGMPGLRQPLEEHRQEEMIRHGKNQNDNTAGGDGWR